MKRMTYWVLALMLCSATTATAQHYKWVDQNGKTRYGDLPPPGVKATLLKMPQGAVVPAAAAPAAPAAGESAKDAAKGAAKDVKKGPLSPAEQEMDYRKRQQEAQAKAKKDEEARAAVAVKQQNCTRAEQGMRTLESGQRVARLDAKGERYFPDEAAIEREKAEIRKVIRENCA